MMKKTAESQAQELELNMLLLLKLLDESNPKGASLVKINEVMLEIADEIDLINCATEIHREELNVNLENSLDTKNNKSTKHAKAQRFNP
ncbi:hypothetical protein VCHA53O466_40400 [Vibrio chagasii]|nr:hypothetical protein VCHA53O466_40400 [Vibrio chagasii]